MGAERNCCCRCGIDSAAGSIGLNLSEDGPGLDKAYALPEAEGVHLTLCFAMPAAFGGSDIATGLLLATGAGSSCLGAGRGTDDTGLDAGNEVPRVSCDTSCFLSRSLYLWAA